MVRINGLKSPWIIIIKWLFYCAVIWFERSICLLCIVRRPMQRNGVIKMIFNSYFVVENVIIEYAIGGRKCVNFESCTHSKCFAWCEVFVFIWNVSRKFDFWWRCYMQMQFLVNTYIVHIYSYNELLLLSSTSNWIEKKNSH